jgi:hypothetical protein
LKKYTELETEFTQQDHWFNPSIAHHVFNSLAVIPDSGIPHCHTLSQQGISVATIRTRKSRYKLLTVHGQECLTGEHRQTWWMAIPG